MVGFRVRVQHSVRTEEAFELARLRFGERGPMPAVILRLVAAAVQKRFVLDRLGDVTPKRPKPVACSQARLRLCVFVHRCFKNIRPMLVCPTHKP